MGLLTKFAALFSGSKETAQTQASEEAILYKGFRIVPAPIAEGGQYRVAADISMGEGETLREHRFIRSDVIANRSDCIDITINKAKMTIDQVGEGIF